MLDRFIYTGMAAALIAAALSGCADHSADNGNSQSAQQVAVQKVDQRKLAPAHETTPKKVDFTLKNLDGQDVKLSDYAGKVVIVDFWDTWCGPCVMEIPHFVELQKQYGEKGFQMVGVAFGQQGLDAVKSFVKDKNVNYVNVLATPEVVKLFGEGYDGQPISGIPTTFIIKPDGTIHKKFVGYIEKNVFEQEIKALLPTG